jgi:hypothetical protein
MRILITGSRDWIFPGPIRDAIAVVPTGSTVIHGDCKSADKMAASIAKELGLTVEDYPADRDRYGPKKAGPIRNSQMVATGPDVCLAFGDTGGTMDCVSKAKAAGIPVFQHPIPKNWPELLERTIRQARLPGLD